jgi:leucyl aminopeptidase
VTSLTTTTRDPGSLDVDALVVGTVTTADGVDLAPGHGLGDDAVDHLRTVLGDLGSTAEVDEVTRVVAVPGVAARAVVLTGLGEADAVGPDALREAAAAGTRAVATKGTVALALPTADLASVAAVADGAYAGCYRYDKVTGAARETPGRAGRAKARSRTSTTPGGGGATPAGSPEAAGPDGPELTVVSAAGDGAEVTRAVERAAVLGAARDLARDLVNTPPNLLTPQGFVDRVQEAVAASPGAVTVDVLDERALAEGGFGGIVGVGQGSANPPRIVTMTYAPPQAHGSVALVGKGITFDSGGLCIKPAASMLTMKSDMAGAAAVAATVLAAAELGGPVAVRGYLCLAENMPSGTAQRPGDVVTMRDGTTVEILDTDAEGRMVLGDGICLALERSPDTVVDIATLTGAQMVALGPSVAGVMANGDAMRARVVAAADAAGEPAWPMPLPEALRKGLESAVADLAHKADRWGGMLTAGLFLQTFVPDEVPWAHVDIAGPSFNEKGPHGSVPKGGTGYGVATLLALVEGHAAD